MFLWVNVYVCSNTKFKTKKEEFMLDIFFITSYKNKVNKKNIWVNSVLYMAFCLIHITSFKYYVFADSTGSISNNYNQAYANKTVRHLPNTLSVSINKKLFEKGESIEIILENKAKDIVYLPGCQEYTVQKFLNGKYVDLPQTSYECSSEKNSLELPFGKKIVKYEPSYKESENLRIAVVYGIGCQKNVPLSSSFCKSFDVSYSTAFSTRTK